MVLKISINNKKQTEKQRKHKSIIFKSKQQEKAIKKENFS